MTNPPASLPRRLLVESLTLLAADASAQRAWLDTYAVGPDEIALDFDHASRMLPGMVEAGLADDEDVPDLRAIDGILGGMSGPEDAERWTRDALADDPGWEEARRLARRVLVRMLGEWRLPFPEITVVR
ncbi:hypothetical protein [Streptomyces triculaminicus]|uniref:hypothetical protein n=1 Tax=Streptomyces triculaminicus TaxID=2816232 RepID=UPI0037D02A55